MRNIPVLAAATALAACSANSEPVTIEGGANPVKFDLGEGRNLDWTVDPSIERDTFSFECATDTPTHVTVTSDRDEHIFELKGLETVDFDILLDGMEPAGTRLACLPPSLSFKGDYADPSAEDPFGDALASGGMFEKHLARMMEVRLVPGTAIVVTRGDETLLAKGYGTKQPDGGGAVDTDTHFRLASATKVLTSLVIFSLVEDGVLSLDQEMADLIDDTPETWDGITVAQILNHSSGIPMLFADPGYRDLTPDQQNAMSFEDIYRTVRDKPLDFEPGSVSAYRQSGYAILAYAVEQATGRSWDELLAERVLSPAGMTGTRFASGFDDGAKDYRLDNGELVDARDYHYSPSLGIVAGGIITTASDMEQLFKAMAAGKIVDLDAYASALFDEDHIPPGSSYSLGSVIETYPNGKSFGHSGGNMADLRYFPDAKIGIAFLSNRNDNRMQSDVTREISELAMGVQE